MLIKSKRRWELPESLVTPEPVFLNRRAFMAGVAGAAVARRSRHRVRRGRSLRRALSGAAQSRNTRMPGAPSPTRNTTSTTIISMSSARRRIAAEAEKLPIRPWEIAIDGEIDKPFTIGIDDLLKKVTLEERIYRHRCVEAWSMVVPWTGFPLKELVELAKPKAGAKYVRFETFNRSGHGLGPAAGPLRHHALALYRRPHHGRGHA